MPTQPQHSPSQARTPGSHISRLDTLRQTSHINGFERWSILWVLHQLKHDDEERDASVGFHYRRWSERTSRLLGRSLRSVQKVTAGWNNLFQSGIPDDEPVRTYVFDTSGKGNRTPKPKRVPDCTSIVHNPRDFVRQNRLNREQFTAVDALQFLIANEMLMVRRNPNGDFVDKDYAPAQRSVQLFLHRNGFLRGSSTATVRVNPRHPAARNEYLRKLMENRQSSRETSLMEVYTDESYPHHHYRLDTLSLYHEITSILLAN